MLRNKYIIGTSEQDQSDISALGCILDVIGHGIETVTVTTDNKKVQWYSLGKKEDKGIVMIDDYAILLVTNNSTGLGHFIAVRKSTIKKYSDNELITMCSSGNWEGTLSIARESERITGAKLSKEVKVEKAKEVKVEKAKEVKIEKTKADKVVKFNSDAVSDKDIKDLISAGIFDSPKIEKKSVHTPVIHSILINTKKTDTSKSVGPKISSAFESEYPKTTGMQHATIDLVDGKYIRTIYMMSSVVRSHEVKPEHISV